MEGLSDLPNLASAQLGASIIYATDEWFAAADNMISDSDPVWKQDDYTPFGKWMDGWESRRRRTAGHDWCIVQLALPGVPRLIEIDTAFFTGNFSPKVSVYGINIDSSSADAATIATLSTLREESVVDRSEFGRMGLCATDAENAAVAQLRSDNWHVLVPLTPLGAGYEETRRTYFKLPVASSPSSATTSTPAATTTSAAATTSAAGVVTHLRVNMGPDGGIARLRVYGDVVVNPATLSTLPTGELDLASVLHGGQALACSNRHYGHPRNLISTGRGNCMGDGWETARQPARPAVYSIDERGLLLLPGCDWALLKLGVVGFVSSLEVDTNFYKGNYPESCMIEACCLPEGCNINDALLTEGAQQQQQQQQQQRIDWKVLLPRVRLGPSAQHFFRLSEGDINNVGQVSHVKVTIYPDGGIMRIRVLGKRSPDSRL